MRELNLELTCFPPRFLKNELQSGENQVSGKLQV